MAVCKPRRRPPEEPALWQLDLRLQASELWENKYLLFKPHQEYFVMTAPGEFTISNGCDGNSGVKVRKAPRMVKALSGPSLCRFASALRSVVVLVLP